MFTFLIIISLILHGISILAIITLYLRQNKYSESERRLERLQREFDESMQSYLIEIKDQNEEMGSLLSSLKKEHEHGDIRPSQESPTSKLEALEKKVKPDFQPSSEKWDSPPPLSENVETININYVPPYMNIKDKLEFSGNGHADIPQKLPEQDYGARIGIKGTNKTAPSNNEEIQKPKTASGTAKEHTVVPWEVRAIELKEKNYDIDQIAKELKKGKTEIELLLKFQTRS